MKQEWRGIQAIPVWTRKYFQNEVFVILQTLLPVMLSYCRYKTNAATLFTPHIKTHGHKIFFFVFS
jgi:hypothetical protein